MEAEEVEEEEELEEQKGKEMRSEKVDSHFSRSWRRAAASGSSFTSFFFKASCRFFSWEGPVRSRNRRKSVDMIAEPSEGGIVTKRKEGARETRARVSESEREREPKKRRIGTKRDAQR